VNERTVAIMRRPRRTLFVVAALAAAVLAGCTAKARAPGLDAESSTVPSSGQPLTSVIMVGDSITDGAKDGVRFAFEAKGFTDITVDAQWGRRIRVGNGVDEPLNGLDAVRNLQAAGANPDVWVIALGTNDLGQYATADAYGAVIDEMLALIPADKPLVWVNTFRADQLNDTVLYNLTLQGRLIARGNAQLTDWYAIASQPGQEALLTDGVHPSRDGYGIFSLAVAESLGTAAGAANAPG
jgi:lysophospholipase L1-like esterase